MQEAPPARVAPDRLMRLDPGIAEINPPPQVPSKPLLGSATANPAGRGSVKAMFDRVTLFGFVMVKVRAVLGPNS